MIRNFQFGLLYLVRLLIDADGVTDEKELEALRFIKDRENIPDEVYQEFEEKVLTLKENELYHAAIHELEQCSLQEKLTIFALLYKLSEVDGRVHMKEIKLLLYSIKTAGLNFDEVVTHAKHTPELFV